MRQSLCRVPLMAFWLMASTFALVGGAHAEEHPSLKGKNDALCNVSARETWDSLQRSLDYEAIDKTTALVHMECSYRDGEGQSRLNSILYILATYNVMAGSFAWDIIYQLEESGQIDFLLPLVIGIEPDTNIFDEIESALSVSKGNTIVVEELVEMKRALCLTIRKHQIADLKPIYMQNCVK